jgi:acyl dehydratase
LTMAMTGRVVTDWFGPQRLVAFGMRFLGQVWPGDTLTVRARVSAVHDGQVEVDLVTVTQREVRVAAGYAKVAFL